MITRLIVVDPAPVAGRSDLLVYQVPEHSREYAVLIEAFEKMGLEWDEVKSVRKVKTVKTQGD